MTDTKHPHPYAQGKADSLAGRHYRPVGLTGQDVMAYAKGYADGESVELAPAIGDPYNAGRADAEGGLKYRALRLGYRGKDVPAYSRGYEDGTRYAWIMAMHHDMAAS